MTMRGCACALSLLLALSAGASAFTCPAGAGLLPPAFHGSAASPALGTLVATGTTLYLTPAQDAIGSVFCILSVFVNPNNPAAAFITLGAAANPVADQDVSCAYLDLSAAPARVLFNVSDDTGQSCPMATGLPFAGWRAGAAAAPACPRASAPLPAALAGVGRLADAQHSGSSRLELQGSAWTAVDQGALASVRCVASVSTAAAQGVTQLTFSNAVAAGGAQEGCAWVQPQPPAQLRYKLGLGSACPTDFSRPHTIPFNFSSAAPPPLPPPQQAQPYELPDFLISFWVDPIVPQAQFPLEYARIANANYTAVMGGFGATTPGAVAAQVAACAGAGLMCIPTSCETAASPGGSGSCIGIGLNDSALLGYQLWDEPQASDFPAVAAWMASVAQRTQPRALLRFVNLLPNYATFPGTYEEYLAAFVAAAAPDLLSFDSYPLFPGTAFAPAGNMSMEGYRLNLQSVRAAAQNAGIGFVNFLNAMPYGGRPDVTEAQLRWQAFTSLAYGARGILYFCYWSPTGDTFAWGNAIMTPRALPGQAPVYSEGPHFAQVARLNAKLLPLGRLLLRAASVAVGLAQGNGTLVPAPFAGSPIVRLASAIPDLSFSALLGLFSGAWGSQRQAVVLHNQDVGAPLLLRLELAAGAPQPLECTSSDGSLVPAYNDAPGVPGFTVALEAGDARVLFF
jgi:hypothetical protein